MVKPMETESNLSMDSGGLLSFLIKDIRKTVRQQKERIMPAGSSYGAAITRPRVSQKRTKLAPKRAQGELKAAYHSRRAVLQYEEQSARRSLKVLHEKPPHSLPVYWKASTAENGAAIPECQGAGNIFA